MACRHHNDDGDKLTPGYEEPCPKQSFPQETSYPYRLSVSFPFIPSMSVSNPVKISIGAGGQPKT